MIASVSITIYTGKMLRRNTDNRKHRVSIKNYRKNRQWPQAQSSLYLRQDVEGTGHKDGSVSEDEEEELEDVG